MRRGSAHNPFSSVHVSPEAGEYLFVERDGFANLADRLTAAGWKAQLVGLAGVGKSTLMAMLRRETARRGHVCFWWRCTDEASRLPWNWRLVLLRATFKDSTRVGATHAEQDKGAAGSSVIVFLDGGERLRVSDLAALKNACRRRGAGLVMTTHWLVDFEGALAVPIVTDPAALQKFVARLLARHNLPTEMAESVPQRLAARCGDARQVLLDLYDQFEEAGLSVERTE